MATNDTFANTNLSSTKDRSVFFCPQLPELIWDLNNTTFPWILVVIVFVTSPFTVFFNSLVIVTLKKRRELRKRSNILLYSMAVTDLLTGAITMPLSATIDALIIGQVPFEHICRLDSLVNKPMIFLLSISSLYHLTAIAWERYTAIKRWIKYRNKVTERRLKRLAIAVWLFAVITQGPSLLLVEADVDRKFRTMGLAVLSVVVISCLATVAFFYLMIFFEVRKRDRNQINKVAFSAKTRLECKVAKTTAMVTVAIVLSFFLSVSITILGMIFPVIRAYSAHRLTEALVQFNSLASPLLYSYRDQRFRNAIQELLGLKKSPPQVQQRLNGRRNLGRRESVGLVNLAAQRQGTLALLSKRSASVELAAVNIDRNPKLLLERSLSDPTPARCYKTSIAGKLNPQQLATIPGTSTVIHNERSKSRATRKNRRKIHAVPSIAQTSSTWAEGKGNSSRVSRSKSWDKRAEGNISSRWQNSQSKGTRRRPETEPSNVIYPNENSAQLKVSKKADTNSSEGPF